MNLMRTPQHLEARQLKLSRGTSQVWTFTKVLQRSLLSSKLRTSNEVDNVTLKAKQNNGKLKSSTLMVLSTKSSLGTRRKVNGRRAHNLGYPDEFDRRAYHTAATSNRVKARSEREWGDGNESINCRISAGSRPRVCFCRGAGFSSSNAGITFSTNTAPLFITTHKQKQPGSCIQGLLKLRYNGYTFQHCGRRVCKKSTTEF
jgi:hypothetical protein